MCCTRELVSTYILRLNTHMHHQLVVILARFLQSQNQHQHLLQPIARLEKVIKFDVVLHVPVWVVEPKVLSAVPPCRFLVHDPDTYAASR